MVVLPSSSFWLSLGISSLTLSVTLGAGACGKSGGKAGASDDAEVQPDLTKVLTLRKKAVPPPEIIHLSFNKDPGFQVPLEAAARFGSIKAMLPDALRPISMWTSLELTMADGTKQTIEAPRSTYGEASYVLQSAAPGQKLVVLDKDSEAVKASFGPLAAIHVVTSAVPAPEAPPFALVIDGSEHTVGPEILGGLATVVEPAKGKPAWKVGALVEAVAPECVLSGLSVTGGQETFEVDIAEAAQGYLRVNKRSVLMFSLSEGQRETKRVREVSRIDVSCAPR